MTPATQIASACLGATGSRTFQAMDPTYPAHVEAFRQRVRRFLEERLPPGWQGIGRLGPDEAREFAARWRAELAAHGFLAPSWPKEYGGPGLSEIEQVVLFQELQAAGVPTGTQNDAFSIGMVGNTILRHGTEAQKRHFLPRILSGEDVWCQGFSEPEAGSDLAGLRCSAVLDGDEWVINGQKIWTSCAHLANWIFLLARTNPSAPRHRGISFLLVPLDQPGVEVRRIRMMNGDEDFCEVFFADARCPRENVVGEVDGGWAVAMTLLGYERGESAVVYPAMFRAELDRLVELARSLGLTDDPVVRQRLASLHARVEVMRFLGLRSLTSFLRGEPPGPEAAIFKLYWSEYHRDAAATAVDLLGPAATAPWGKWPNTSTPTDDPGAPNLPASWVGTFYTSRAGTIYAGTSEIQRNIIGEIVLGLPKEPGRGAA